jgi:frataxin
MDEAMYHELAESLLEELQDAIEMADEEGKIDVMMEENVLTITLQDGNEYIINKHFPTKQVWVSSPDSGATHFKYDEDEENWVNSEGIIIQELIADELQKLAGVNVDL